MVIPHLTTHNSAEARYLHRIKGAGSGLYY